MLKVVIYPGPSSKALRERKGRKRRAKVNGRLRGDPSRPPSVPLRARVYIGALTKFAARDEALSRGRKLHFFNCRLLEPLPPPPRLMSDSRRSGARWRPAFPRWAPHACARRRCAAVYPADRGGPLIRAWRRLISAIFPLWNHRSVVASFNSICRYAEALY